MRIVLSLVALALLGGCNMVLSTKPLFSAADAARPGLKPGVWDAPPNADCVFDESSPMKSWPDCAQGVVLGDDTMSGWDTDKGQRVWKTIHYRLAGGEPSIFQFYLPDMAGADAPPMAYYAYGAVHPTARDGDGRITAYQFWLVFCGPPPPPDAKAAKGGMRGATLQPLPGLEIDRTQSNCLARTRSAVRGAAGPSRAWNKDDPTVQHWVRAGDEASASGNAGADLRAVDDEYQPPVPRKPR